MNERLHIIAAETSSEKESDLPFTPLTEQEREDVKWPPSRKEWDEYWRARIDPERHLSFTQMRNAVNIIVSDLKTRARIELEWRLSGELPSEEAEDLKHSPGTEGWESYWRDKIRENPGDVPEEVAAWAEEYESGWNIPVVVKQYVRHKALRLQEMARLKRDLRRIDRGEPSEEHADKRAIMHDTETGGLYAVRGKEKESVSEGDLMGDMVWGIRYEPSGDFPRGEWRRLRKMLAVREARNAIEAELDQFIAAREKLGFGTAAVPIERLEKVKSARKWAGCIAERMAYSLMVRYQYDHPEEGVVVERANVYEDSALKYDFKVRVPVKRLGIALEGDSVPRERYAAEKKAFGIQFTISKSAGSLTGKEKQIEEAMERVARDSEPYVRYKVDSIVLVAVPLKTYASCFATWRDEGKPCGGPEQYLTKSERDALVNAIFEGISGAEKNPAHEELRMAA